MIFRKKLPEIAYASTYFEALKYTNLGFVPVELSFGNNSVVDDYNLDHHGNLHSCPSVSLTAFHNVKSHLFVPSHKFVVTGRPDADAIYAILLLSKTIEPSLDLAQAIAQLDTDPVGIDQRENFYLQAGPAFRMHHHFTADVQSYYRALHIGKTVFSSEGLSRRLTKRALAYEDWRRTMALQTVFPRQSRVAFARSDTDSMDIWLTRYDCNGQPLDLVVQYKPTLKILTIAGKTPEAVQRLHNSSKPATAYFSEHGLLDYCNTLDDLIGITEPLCEISGSGGRPTIIGSPRGHGISLEVARKIVYRHLRDHVRAHNNPPSPIRAA
jgi:hypothetical protein